jgi:hypothetical protein
MKHKQFAIVSDAVGRRLELRVSTERDSINKSTPVKAINVRPVPEQFPKRVDASTHDCFDQWSSVTTYTVHSAMEINVSSCIDKPADFGDIAICDRVNKVVAKFSCDGTRPSTFLGIDYLSS